MDRMTLAEPPAYTRGGALRRGGGGGGGGGGRGGGGGGGGGEGGIAASWSFGRLRQLNFCLPLIKILAAPLVNDLWDMYITACYRE